MSASRPASIGQRFPDNDLGPRAVPRPYAVARWADRYGLLRPAERFHAVIGADVPEAATTLAAAAQRPVDQSAFVEPPTAAAWKTIPSWFVIGGRTERSIPPRCASWLSARTAA